MRPRAWMGAHARSGTRAPQRGSRARRSIGAWYSLSKHKNALILFLYFSLQNFKRLIGGYLAVNYRPDTVITRAADKQWLQKRQHNRWAPFLISGGDGRFSFGSGNIIVACYCQDESVAVSWWSL